MSWLQQLLLILSNDKRLASKVEKICPEKKKKKWRENRVAGMVANNLLFLKGLPCDRHFDSTYEETIILNVLHFYLTFIGSHNSKRLSPRMFSNIISLSLEAELWANFLLLLGAQQKETIIWFVFKSTWTDCNATKVTILFRLILQVAIISNFHFYTIIQFVSQLWRVRTKKQSSIQFVSQFSIKKLDF